MSDDSSEVRIARLEERYTAQQEAIGLARKDIERRLDEMNQFRAQINEERNIFMRKDTFDARHGELEGKVSKTELWKSNMEGRMWMLGALITGFMVLIQIAFRYWLK
jgi:hypothetical protein